MRTLLVDEVDEETPPRAWGRRRWSWVDPLKDRNTPTGVGKTLGTRYRHAAAEKHPHGRGEDCTLPLLGALLWETPPRAWGRPLHDEYSHGCLGNTPTGVGKTAHPAHSLPQAWKHPHGRGEDRTRRSHWRPCRETPPRAWGRHAASFLHLLNERNTPTGVGKTCAAYHSRLRVWKHPHGRGEDSEIPSSRACA